MSNQQQNTVAWPQRFGTVKSIALKTGKNGRYAIITVDCKKFTQVAYAFTEKVIEQITAAGEGAQVWFKGPFEPVTKKNANGGTYTEDQMKVVYFKDKTERAEGAEAPQAAAEEPAPQPVKPQDLTAIKGIGAGVAAKLAAVGIETYAGLAEATDEVLETAGAGTAKRATSGNWRAQAAEMVAAAAEAEKAEAAKAVDDEIAF